MLTIDPRRSLLLVIDFQSRLMPVVHEGETAIRLIQAAKHTGISRRFTKPNAEDLGSTVAGLPVEEDQQIDEISSGKTLRS